MAEGRGHGHTIHLLRYLLKEEGRHDLVCSRYSHLVAYFKSVRSTAMVADKSANDVSDFTIKDNVLIGVQVPLSNEYTSVGKLLLDKMKAKPDFIGQIDATTEETYNFAKMTDQMVKCALWLRKQNIKPGDVVAVCTPNNMDSFAPFFASFCVSAIFTPWNSEMNTREARHFLTLSGAKLVFASEDSVSTLLEAAKLENYDLKVVVFGNAPNALPFSKVLEGHSTSDVENFQCTPVNDIDDTAAILYSSGTTGLSKGVQISHSALLYNLLSAGGLKLDGTPLWFSSYFWISGVLCTMSCIVNYNLRIIYPKFEEKILCELAEKYKVTWLFLSPSMANRLLKSGYLKKYDLSSVKFVCIGGAIFKAESQITLQKQLPQADIIQMFGMTELACVVTSQKPHHKPGSVGTPIKNVQIKIVELETGNALGPNKKGELWVKSKTMTKGYYKNPQATKETIDAEGWLHTGDLAYYDENGELYIVDRIKEILKYRGYHVSPTEIENFLQTHPDVVEAAIVGIPHLEDDEHPLAFVSVVPGSKVTEHELQKFVADNMTERNHLRAGVKFLESLPHTPSGKVCRKDLKAMAKSYQVK
ncbi:hypothetical protein KPH14_007815 [Odynerus spinipes]|uniref:Uncharacterized protein n=1 Tax=Odynerus spinipes TaxID=1348599 RepID=A0AAD9S0E5_9HYME|nr:hypothetical protein KPH14_007815 [Odynerus spinipes]